MKFNNYFKPMLLSERARAFDDDGYLYEMKFDGYRATMHVSPNSIKIFSRNGTLLNDNFPELENIKKLVREKVIFDGEIVIFDGKKPNFSILQKRARIKSKKKILDFAENLPAVFVAFDCLYKSRDITSKSLFERKKVLDSFKENDYFIKSVYVIGKGRDLFKRIKMLDLEGIVAKRIDSKYYIDERSREWIKIKNYKRKKFLIGGFVNTDFKKSLLLGEYRNDGKFYFVGKVSVTKSFIFKSKVIQKSPFCNYEESDVGYFKPIEECEVVYIERTENNNLREPVFKRMC